jgi:rhodanese-related sulfurtransferase
VLDFGQAIACCCARGHRNAVAAYQLQQLGYERVASLRDGLER